MLCENDLFREESYHADIHTFYSESLDFRMPVPHFHDGYEINLTMTDNTTFYIANHVYVAKGGSIAVINDQEIHKTAVDKGLYRRAVLNFRPQFIHEITTTNPELLYPFTKRFSGFSHVMALTTQQQESLFHYMKHMIHLHHNPGIFGCLLKKKITLLEILMIVSEAFSTNSNMMWTKNSWNNERFDHVLDYIHNHLADELTLDRLAAIVYISKSNLIRCFKAALGTTPNQYIKMCRIMKSREYLKKQMPIHKVCELVGYKDQSSFIRSFKEIIGTTPKKYAGL